ncbi:MAG: arginine--tRNA ligase [Candidatus ainarchaeum sp.]|nr:arginine--tRNA ligase [Candidatus ainarchaeum sp.]
MDAFTEMKREAARVVASACGSVGYQVSEEDVFCKLEVPKEEFGDIASPVAFDVARAERTSPRKIAEKITVAMRMFSLVPGPFFVNAKVAGAGYVNLYLDAAAFSEKVLNEVQAGGGDYGRNDSGKGRRAIVEFPSVNPNKPWHVGHLRNAVLGDSVARLLEFSGYSVQRMDYIDDLGLQVAQSVWGYLHLSGRIEGKADHWLGAQYVKVAKKIGDEKVEAEVRGIVKEMEEGGSQTAEKARELAMKCVLAQYETAFKLGIFHDVLLWESDIVRGKLFDAAVRMALESGAAVREAGGKNAGCVVARLEGAQGFEGMESADKVLVRSDGTAVYTGKDLAFQLWKFGLIESGFRFSELLVQPNGRKLYTSGKAGKPDARFGKADLVVNVIGVEQAYPQLVLKVLLKAMGFAAQSENSVHLAYEHAALPEGKFSGRAGTWVGFTADELLAETEAEAQKQVRERFKDMGEKEKRAVAAMVSVGAIRFDFLRTTPERKLVFKWEEALKFDGDTAPYVQYSHARAARILEKAGKPGGKPDYAALSSPDEMRLVKRLALFPETAAGAAKAYRPHMVADYLLDLSKDFSRFYANCPVLQADGKAKAARLKLVSCYKSVCRNGLLLLGIGAPERM